jgi:hypothetical protein
MSTTRPYEVLARFNRDGTVSGVSVRTIITVDGRDFESDPTPLAETTDPAFTAFAAQFAAAAVTQRDALAAECATLRQRVAELEVQLGQQPAPGGEVVLSAIQLRSGLLSFGVTSQQVDALIRQAVPRDQVADALLRWEYATVFVRSHPLIDPIGVALLGVDTAQLDTLWQQWSSIQ